MGSFTSSRSSQHKHNIGLLVTHPEKRKECPIKRFLSFLISRFLPFQNLVFWLYCLGSRTHRDTASAVNKPWTASTLISTSILGDIHSIHALNKVKASCVDIAWLKYANMYFHLHFLRVANLTIEITMPSAFAMYWYVNAWETGVMNLASKMYFRIKWVRSVHSTVQGTRRPVH